jgi:hypothetical protein
MFEVEKKRAHYIAARCAAALLLLCAMPAFAISDEIQVYTDDINKPGEYGLELHMNTTPVGISTRPYPGGSVSRHGFRLTPEFSYGINDDFEAGLYLPTVRESDGSLSASGAKLRLKWLPLKPAEGNAGWFGGVNLELARVDQRYSEVPLSSEARFIGGYRAQEWLVSVNPIFGFDLSPGYRNGGPDFTLGLKGAHDVRPGLALGLEYYSAMGKIAHTLPSNLQENTLYFVIDYDQAPWAVNFGVGRGLNGATDTWTVKTIVSVPF